MKYNRKWLAGLAAVLTAAHLTSAVAAVPEIPFTDVPQDEWYYEDVRSAYDMALIDGRTPTTFAPDELLTHAEAVKLAACMYQVYTDDAPFVVTAEPWYQIYADYCYENRIINREYDWDQHITRAAYMDIFARALPKDALPAINSVDDGMIPDVPMTHRYAQSIYSLYRAGVVRGQDAKGSCAPDSYVKRSEVAAILSRMMDETKRVTVTLEDPALKPQTPETTAPETTPVQPSVPSSGENVYYPIIIPGTGSGGWYPGGSSGNTGNSSGTSFPGNSGSSTPGTEPEEKMPWEIPGAKQPSAYTWDEYDALSDAQQIEFQIFLGARGFEDWRDRAFADMEGDADITVNHPWETPGAKQPGEYSWEEYERLSDAQKAAFRAVLGEGGFESWKNRAQNGGGEPYPWETQGAKQPGEYSFAEYERLSADQQIAFQNALGESAFTSWMENARGSSAEDGSDGASEANPWEAEGAVQPADYTYAEYNGLTLSQQIAFQKHLGDGFDAWLQKAQGDGSVEGQNPWEAEGAVQPADYTYAEYDALTPAQQIAFQKYLGDGFDAWLQKAKGDGSVEEPNPWEAEGATQPADYTYAEYDALTPAQQIAFQKYLGDGFDAWLQKAKGNDTGDGPNPWEAEGATQPADYTYAEFIALPPAQQMAFQRYLGESGFEAWLTKNPAPEQ